VARRYGRTGPYTTYLGEPWAMSRRSSARSWAKHGLSSFLLLIKNLESATKSILPSRPTARRARSESISQTSVLAITSGFFQASHQASLMAHTHNNQPTRNLEQPLRHTGKAKDADDSELSYYDSPEIPFLSLLILFSPNYHFKELQRKKTIFWVDGWRQHCIGMKSREKVSIKSCLTSEQLLSFT
jgi:hypothetical protein